MFGKAWREERIALYEDSTLAWFKQKGRLEPDGSLVLKEVPTGRQSGAQGGAISQWTLHIPGRPDLPSGCHVVQFIALGSRRGDEVHWPVAQSGDEVK